MVARLGIGGYESLRGLRPPRIHEPRFVDRILSVRQTCRLNNRSMHDYLIEIHHTRLTREDIPIPFTPDQIAA